MFKKNPPDKSSFFAGLAVGIIIILIIGLIIIIIFRESQDQASVQKQASVNLTQAPGIKSKKNYDFDISPIDHIYGQFDATLTLVVFSDMECVFSAIFHQSCSRLLLDAEYYNQVRLVWRHFPLNSIHPQAQAAAIASECAARQGKFWQFIDQLLDDQDKLSSQRYLQIAENLDINLADFKPCLKEQSVHDIVEAHHQEGSAKGVYRTPTIFINHQKIEGALPFKELKALVDKELE